jgi:hypothetical protein
MAAISTLIGHPDSATMDDYLRSEVFFKVSRFPDVRFVSTGVEKRDEHDARVTGDPTMHGVTGGRLNKRPNSNAAVQPSVL